MFERLIEFTLKNRLLVVLLFVVTCAAGGWTLARLPVDEVRIDGSLVSDMLRDATHAKIVRSLVHLAQDMEFRVAAGGVEDAETARALGTLGCERIQGSYVSPPLTPQEILEKFASRRSGAANGKG